MRPNVDGNDLGFGHRIGLAAKPDVTLRERRTPEMLLSRRRGAGSPHAARAFSSKVQRGSRARKTRQIENLEHRFDSLETEKAAWRS